MGDKTEGKRKKEAKKPQKTPNGAGYNEKKP